MKTRGQLPLIRLIGDPEENFYQLGLKDRERHEALLKAAVGLVKSPWESVNRGFRLIAQGAVKKAMSLHPGFKRKISAYAEGLGRPPEEVALALLTPELVSCLDSWLPGVSPGILGCSSYFSWDEKRNAPIHGRVLDFPLFGPFEAEERALLTQFTGGPKVMSFGSAGFPYPSITCMNEYGVSLALHQKFTDIFEPRGTPIFELIYELIHSVSNIEEALAFLKRSRSLTTWALYMGFNDGQVLAVDIMGDRIHANRHQIEPGKVLYLCNHLEDPKLNQRDYLPTGIDDYNHMRSEKVKRKLSKQKIDHAETLIKVMATPLQEKRKWQADPITPSSLQSVVMVPTTGEALFIPDEGPKFFRQQWIEIKEIWTNSGPIEQVHKSRAKATDENFYQGQRHMMLAQVGHDSGESHLVYHHLQMAIHFLKDFPEVVIARFFLAVFQYMHEPHIKMRELLIQDFRDLSPKLPPYLSDQALLFIVRLEHVLNRPMTVNTADIERKELRSIAEFEKKIKPWALDKLRGLMNPRIDILDIIYAHVHPGKTKA